MGCRPSFFSFFHFLSLSSLSYQQNTLFSLLFYLLLRWEMWVVAVVRRGGRPEPKGGAAASELKAPLFFNFFLVFHSISYPLLVSKLQILRKWTIHPRSKTESMKRKKLLPLLSLADPSVKVADWSWFLCFPRLFVRVCVFETIPVVLWLQVLMNWSLEFEICGLFVLVMLRFLVSGL